jgi:hypothetical protein
MIFSLYRSVDLGDFNRAEKGRKLSMVGDLTEFQRLEKGRKLSLLLVNSSNSRCVVTYNSEKI